MDPIIQEVAGLLRWVTVIQTDMAPYPRLSSRLRTELGTRLSPQHDDEVFLVALVFEAALRSGPPGNVSKLGETYPLLAAKHLLALGTYPENDALQVPDTGMTMRQLRNLGQGEKPIMGSPFQPDAFGLRARIAAVAGRYGKSRGVFGKKNAPRLIEVATALWDEMHSILNEADLAQTLEQRIESAGLGKTIGAVHTEGNTQSIEKQEEDYRARIVLRLDRSAASYYPEQLSNRRLSSWLRLSRLRHYESEIAQHGILPDDILQGYGSPAFEALQSARRAVIVGDTGSGKSTVALAWLAQLIEREKVAGVFARAAELAKRASVSRPTTTEAARRVLMDSFEDWLGEALPDVLARILTLEFSNEAFLVVVDGIDEIEDQEQLDAFARLMNIIEGGRSRILLTSRKAGYRKVLSDSKDFILLPLSDSASRAVLKEWFSISGDAISLARATEFAKEHEELAGNPLTLGLIALIATWENPPRFIGELFDACLRYFLTRIWKPIVQQRGDDFAVEVALDSLKNIAWQLTRDRPSVDGSELGMPSRVTTKDILRFARDENVARILVRVDGLLVATSAVGSPQSRPKVTYRWLHSGFRDHLVGSYLADLYAVDKDAAIREACSALLRGWSEHGVLRHAISLLNVIEQTELSDALLQTAIHAPYRSVSHSPFTDLIDLSTWPGVFRDEARATIAKMLFAEGHWNAAFLVDAAAAVDQLANVSGSVHAEQLREMAAFFADMSQQLGNMPSLASLLSYFERLPRHQAGWLLPLIARQDYSTGVRLWLEQLPHFVLLYDNWGDWREDTYRPELDVDLANAVIDQMVAEPLFPLRRTHAQILRFAREGRAEVSRRGLVDPALAFLACVMNVFDGSDPEHLLLPIDPDMVTHAVTGGYGPWGAMQVAEAFPEDTLEETEATVLAVATAELILATAQLTEASFDTRPIDSMDPLVIGKLRARMDSYDPEDARTVRPLIRSLMEVGRHRSLEGFRELMHFEFWTGPKTPDNALIDRRTVQVDGMVPSLYDLVGSLIDALLELFVRTVDTAQVWQIAMSTLLSEGKIAYVPHLVVSSVLISSPVVQTALMDGETSKSVHESRLDELIHWGKANSLDVISMLP